jgi:hypothetical protein
MNLPPLYPKVVILPSWIFESFGEQLVDLGLQVLLGPEMPPNRAVVYCDRGNVIFQLYKDEDDGQPRVEGMIPLPPGPIQLLMPPEGP